MWSPTISQIKITQKDVCPTLKKVLESHCVWLGLYKSVACTHVVFLFTSHWWRQINETLFFWLVKVRGQRSFEWQIRHCQDSQSLLPSQTPCWKCCSQETPTLPYKRHHCSYNLNNRSAWVIPDERPQIFLQVSVWTAANGQTGTVAATADCLLELKVAQTPPPTLVVYSFFIGGQYCLWKRGFFLLFKLMGFGFCVNELL